MLGYTCYQINTIWSIRCVLVHYSRSRSAASSLGNNFWPLAAVSGLRPSGFTKRKKEQEEKTKVTGCRCDGPAITPQSESEDSHKAQCDLTCTSPSCRRTTWRLRQSHLRFLMSVPSSILPLTLPHHRFLLLNCKSLLRAPSPNVTLTQTFLVLFWLHKLEQTSALPHLVPLIGWFLHSLTRPKGIKERNWSTK